MLAKTTDRLEGTEKAMSAMLRGVGATLKTVGIESPAINSLGGAPNVDPIGQTYYSVTPFRYGDYIAKFSLAPAKPEMQALETVKIEIDGREDAIREEVQKDMRGLDAEWAFRVQLCRDLEKQPVEDPTVEWKEDEAPFLKVATVRAARQERWDEALVREVDDQSRFSIWTGLAAHRRSATSTGRATLPTATRPTSAPASTAAPITSRRWPMPDPGPSRERTPRS